MDKEYKFLFESENSVFNKIKELIKKLRGLIIPKIRSIISKIRKLIREKLMKRKKVKDVPEEKVIELYDGDIDNGNVLPKLAQGLINVTNLDYKQKRCRI